MKFKNEKIEQKYFHCYATANDSRLYLKDIQNLMRIKNHYAGFSNVVLFVAISKVKKISLFDKFFKKTVENLFHEHPSIELKEIYFKSNIGRDFSSFQTLFNKVKKMADIENYILFQNRSGLGPMRDNWYQGFVDQFEKFGQVALCGSTINFNDHPKRSFSNNLPHVQTFSFLTKVYYLNMFGDTFPGSTKTEKLDVILYGEIEFSQFFLRKNHKITCMEWPDEPITNQTKPIHPADVKNQVAGEHFFYHKDYYKKNKLKNFSHIIPKIQNWLRFIYKGL